MERSVIIYVANSSFVKNNVYVPMFHNVVV